MNLIFLGAPGAGKGTQADLICGEFDLVPISTGAIIREAIKNETEMGIAAKKFTVAGALVPDDVVIGIIKERLAKDDCKKGFILDGFPRTAPQGKALDEMGVKIDMVISIEVPDDVIATRMSGRRVCNACGATFHTISNPSKKEDKCDKCGDDLIIRKDDEKSVVLSRLKVYHEQTAPLTDFYKSKGAYASVDGTKEISVVTKEIIEILKKV